MTMPFFILCPMGGEDKKCSVDTKEDGTGTAFIFLFVFMIWRLRLDMPNIKARLF